MRIRPSAERHRLSISPLQGLGQWIVLSGVTTCRHIDIKTIYMCACYGEELQKRLNFLKILILRHMFKPLTCLNEGHR